VPSKYMNPDESYRSKSGPGENDDERVTPGVKKH